MSKVITVKSARAGASTVHLAIDIGWSSPPLCGAMKTGKREFTGETANCTPCVKEARLRFLDVDDLVRISSRVWNLINAVKDHAQANYDTAGWDIVVEAYSNSELAELVQPCRTAKGAIARVADVLSIYTERRSHHGAEAAADHPEPVVPAAPKPESVTRWSGSDEGGWYGVETWPGKVGHNAIDPDEGVRYVSGFRQMLMSPGGCDHRSSVWCRQPGCKHPECNPPF